MRKNLLAQITPQWIRTPKGKPCYDAAAYELHFAHAKVARVDQSVVWLDAVNREALQAGMERFGDRVRKALRLAHGVEVEVELVPEASA